MPKASVDGRPEVVGVVHVDVQVGVDIRLVKQWLVNAKRSEITKVFKFTSLKGVVCFYRLLFPCEQSKWGCSTFHQEQDWFTTCFKTCGTNSGAKMCSKNV